MINHERWQFLISGRVQGVGYRISARNIAADLGLTGWVRNLIDDRVEIIAEGDVTLLKQLHIWAKQGPYYANVSNIVIEKSTATNEFDNFVIR